MSALATSCGQSSEEVGGEASRASEAPAKTDGYPPTAKVSVHEQFLDDLAAVRDPSDGGGSARLVLNDGDDGSVRAGTAGRWEFEYTAGPHGIAEGGSLFFLVPPFWGWSTPQTESPDYPGYTTVTCDQEGLALLARTADRSLLQIEINGRDLESEETIRIVYGAGPIGAKADDSAEDNSAFYFKVDGNGDGLSGLVDSRPAIRVLPGPPARLVAHLTSTSSPGGEVFLTLAVLDAMANAGSVFEGRLQLLSEPPGLQVPEFVELNAEAASRVRVPLRAESPGTYRVRVQSTSKDFDESALSNPLRVAPGLEPVLWADLHGHSNYSDGTGTPRDYFEYARDISALDVIVLTDHDHFGVRFMDATPEIWEEIQSEVERINEPGRFVALLGYEWTSWLYGHRHVLYFDGRGEVLSSVGGTTTTPRELWDALAGRQALTFAHHSAGGPVATDWSFVPDPHMEPVTEVMSVHGSSEALDSPSRIGGAVRGNFVRDQLDRGLEFGFIGSGDGHDGHPGHSHLSPNAGYRRTPPDPRGRRANERMGNGGLAAIRAARLDEESLLATLRSRNVYATSGPRIWLDVQLGDFPMGSHVPLGELKSPIGLRVEAAGTSGIETIEIIRKGAEPERLRFDGSLEASLIMELAELRAGDYVYVRLLQNDGALAWSSPFFIE